MNMAVRERIGRYKYTPEKDIEKEYEAICDELTTQAAQQIGKGE